MRKIWKTAGKSHVVLIVNKVVLGQVSPRLHSVSFVIIIPSILHILLHQHAVSSPHIEINQTEAPSNYRKALLNYSCFWYSLTIHD